MNQIYTKKILYKISQIWCMHVIIHESCVDNLAGRYLDIGLSCKGNEKKNKASHFLESFIVMMGCHLWAYKGPCFCAHTIILWISAHWMIVAKSVWKVATVCYINGMRKYGNSCSQMCWALFSQKCKAKEGKNTSENFDNHLLVNHLLWLLRGCSFSRLPVVICK